MTENIIRESEEQERVRKAILKRGGSVTIGDIVTDTGLNTESAKNCLNRLMVSHEGTMRVSNTGELLYAFAKGVILRDQRSWWERNRKKIYSAFKSLFKIVIFLVLLIYFIIYLVIILALLSRRDSDSSDSGLNIGYVFWLFWGNNSSTYANETVNGKKRQPIYTKVYNFVFGPEEEELDPLAAKQQCAQLIRAKNGVVTVEDWMVISGQTRTKCESDLARYTAEFEGNAEIMDDGTLVYEFRDIMKTMSNDANIPQRAYKTGKMPAPAWRNLETPRPLSGNIDGGNGLVIGLNTFNLLCSGYVFLAHAMYHENLAMLQNADDISLTMAISLLTHNIPGVYVGLGVFPFVFSSMIFGIPLIRKFFNDRVNRERRERTVRKALMSTIFDASAGVRIKISRTDAISGANDALKKFALPPVTPKEFDTAMNDLCDELNGERTNDLQHYTFEITKDRLLAAASERQQLDLARQDLGRVVYSTDNGEQQKIWAEENKSDLDDFDRLLGASCSSQPQTQSSFDSDSIYNQGRNHRRDYLGK